MASGISRKLRQLVSRRANQCCEYCLLLQAVSLHQHEPDHIVPRQHGGDTSKSNLALACMRCNRYKGPNVGSFDPETGRLFPFFNPRIQAWVDHFSLDKLSATIELLTAEARVTVRIFHLNDEKRIKERRALISAGISDIS